MKKEEKSTPISSKAKSIYKYELQATNQILKDTLDIYPSSLHSTAQTNRHNTAQLQEYDEYLFDDNSCSKYQEDKKKLNEDYLLKGNHDFHDQRILNTKQQFFQQKQVLKNNFFQQGIFRIKTQKCKKQLENDPDVNQRSLIYQFSSENHQILLPHSSQKNIDNLFKSQKIDENKKELKRQRRGLAHISLKVKNIVARKDRMSFKEVSDEVLRQSEEDLPNDPEQRQKQMKNIRRRVYDALNVLVSADILGKQQRYVIHTKKTNLPGKKLSSYWQVITQKNKLIEKQQNNYRDKQKNLKLLKNNLKSILFLHKRNEQNQSFLCQKQEQPRQKQKILYNFDPPQQKYYFPLIFFIPPKDYQKMKVDIEYQDRQVDCIKKFIIYGNQYLLTDLDMLKYIHLKQQLKRQHVQEIQNYILNLDLCPLLGNPEITFNLKRNKNRQIFEDDIYLED